MNLRKFRTRPGYASSELLIELCGDHRADDYPNVSNLLQEALHSTIQHHPDPGLVSTCAVLDRFISYWRYKNHFYEIDDDWGGLFITSVPYNPVVISDLENALLQSSLFEKEPVDFSNYKSCPT